MAAAAEECERLIVAMPGIFGLITSESDRGSADRRMHLMMQSMSHASPSCRGLYSAPELGCYVGWVCHEGTYSAANPLVDEEEEVAIIMTGEHFEHGGGAGGRTKDAKLLLASYRQLGSQFVQHLNGWFAGVVVDHRRRSILLFNDRFGVHRVYYHEERDVLTFASEAKAVLTAHPETRSLDEQSLGEWLGVGTVLENRTLFAGVSLLPQGSAWSFHRSTIQKTQYFRPEEWERQGPLDPAAFYAALRQTVSNILPAYFRACVPVGVSLTGGLDTRIVMAGMPRDAVPVVSYTYAGAYRECFDIKVARQIAATCSQTHHVIPLGADFFQKFSTFAEQTIWLSDGTLDLCGTHEVYYSALARQLSPIRLTGNYGSEILRGVSTFKYTEPSRTLFDSQVVASAVRAEQSFRAIRASHPVTFAAFQEIPRSLFGRLAAAQAWLTVRSPFMDTELVRLLYRAPSSTEARAETCWRLVADLNPTLATIATDMGYGGHAPIAVSIARRVLRYALFKAEWYYNAGMPDWLAGMDRILDPLAKVFLGTHKIDHYRLWFRNEAGDYLRTLLTDEVSRSRPYVNRQGLDELIRAHVTGRRNCLDEINKVATLELIHRMLIDRDYCSSPV